jgi:hypothetical protein
LALSPDSSSTPRRFRQSLHRPSIPTSAWCQAMAPVYIGGHRSMFGPDPHSGYTQGRDKSMRAELRFPILLPILTWPFRPCWAPH